MKDPKQIRLTQTVKGGGCAAKIGPADLAGVLEGLKIPANPAVLVGLDLADDAGVYKLTDEIALVMTTDFFTPIVDDPYMFGQVAAANALSDVYAMGGTPLAALNLVCHPLDELGPEVLRAVLEGGLDKCTEADVAVVGGHSIRDTELKFGLAVTGTIHPDRILKKHGSKPGDRLILTKPIGTGIVSQAVKKGALTDEQARPAIESMALLNRSAAAIIADLDVHGCTDVTGFGLLGHSTQLVKGTDVGLVLSAEAIPTFEGVLALVRDGVIPGGCHRNRAAYEALLDVDDGVEDAMVNLLFDPQTSGGLLFSLPAEDADGTLEQLHGEGLNAAVVGEVSAERPGRIRLTA